MRSDRLILGRVLILRRLIVALLLGSCPWASLAAERSRLLPFQGRLTDSDGRVVADGSQVVQFKLYNAPVGGQSLWNGEVHKLTVNAGLVSTTLGSKASLSGVDFNQDLYLELTLDANRDGQITLADPPLLPRQSVMPAVFAQEAAEARHAARSTQADDAQTFASHPWSDVEKLQQRVSQLEARLLALEKQVSDGDHQLDQRLVKVEAKTQPIEVRDGHFIIAHGPSDSVFENNGNFAVWIRGGPPRWHVFADAQDMASLKAKTRFWSEDGITLQYTGRERMVWQPDGNTVIYRDGPFAIWQSGTAR